MGFVRKGAYGGRALLLATVATAACAAACARRPDVAPPGSARGDPAGALTRRAPGGPDLAAAYQQMGLVVARGDAPFVASVAHFATASSDSTLLLLSLSLATIAYFLLSGCLPFTGKSPREMFTQLLSQPPIPLNRARQGMTFNHEVEDAIMRALSRQPSDRFPDVTTFADALSRALLAPPAPPPPVEEGGLLSRMKGLFGKKS